MTAKRQPTVLIGYDGSEAAGRAIDEAGWLLGDGRPAIIAFVWQPTEESVGILEGFRGGGAPSGPRPEAEDVLGSVSQDIVNDFRRPTLVV